MVRRIAFHDEDDEASGAVRRRGQQWREERVSTLHRHQPVAKKSPVTKPPATKAPVTKVAPHRSGKNGAWTEGPRMSEGPGPFGRFLRNPLVVILGILVFNVFFIVFLILRAVLLSRGARRPTMEA